MRGGERHRRELLADGGLRRPSRAATASARRMPTSRARRSRSGRRPARQRRTPASSPGDREPGEARAADEDVRAGAVERGPLRPAACRPLRHRRANTDPAAARTPSQGASAARVPMHVVVVALDPVEHPHVDAARDADPGPHGRCQRVGGGRRLGEQRASVADVVGDPLADRDRRRPRAQRVLGETGEVDAVEPPVDRHVAQEVRELEGDAEARDVAVRLGRGAEERRHDQPDGRRAALHVAVELGLGRDPHGLVAVDAHRGHVAAEQVQRQPVAVAGVDEGRDHRMVGVAGPDAAVELRVPGVERRAAGRTGREAPGAVDDLIRTADEAVERVHGRPHVARQAPGRAPERRVVAPLQAPAGPVGLPQPLVGGDGHV